MYDTNKTMEMIGKQTADIMTSETAKSQMLDVLKAHNVRYSADIKDIMHLAIDLYTLGFVNGRNFSES